MNRPNALEPHADFATLKAEAQTLAETLASLLFELNELQTVVKPNLEAIYQVEIGQYVYENFVIQIECRRLKREIELIQAYLNRGDVPDDEAIILILDTEFAEWQKQMREMSATILKSRVHLASALAIEESNELKSLFRALVKRLHPDLNPNLTDYQKALWHQVMEAYEDGDLERLKSLSLYATLDSEEAFDETAIDALRTRITSLRSEIQKCLLQLETLRQTPPISIRENLTDPVWLNAEQEKLREQKESLLAERAYLTAIKESLTRTNQ